MGNVLVMVAYISCFFVTTFLIFISEKEEKKKRKKLALLLGIVSVIILSVLAGIRNYSVGTDINFYILPPYYRALSYIGNFVEYIKNDVYQLEFLYLVLEYIAVSIFKTPHFVMFNISLITNIFIFLGIRKQREYINVPMAWLTYCFLYYNVSLNLMRQSISVAIIFFLFSKVESLNWKKVIIYSIFSSMFHISGLIGIFLYVVYLLLDNKWKGIRQIFLLFFFSLPFSIGYIVQFLISIKIFSGKYTVFVGNQSEIALGNLLFRLIGFISFYLYYVMNHKIENILKFKFLLYMGIMDILFMFNNGLLFYRIGKFFMIFELQYFPLGLRTYTKKKGQRLVYGIVLIVLMFIYWYYQFVVLNIGRTFPYCIDKKIIKL